MPIVTTSISGSDGSVTVTGSLSVSGSDGITTVSTSGSYTSGSDGATSGSGGVTTYTAISGGYSTTSTSGSYTTGSGGSTEMVGGSIIVSGSSPGITLHTSDLLVGGALYVTGAISGAAKLNLLGAATFGSTVVTTGSITAGSSFIIGSADINEADLEKIDGITAGTVIASKAVVVDSNIDATGLRSLTGSGDAKFTNIHATQFYGGGAGITGITAGAPTSISGTTAQLTTGVETSGYLKVTGSSTFVGVATHTGHPIFNTGITIKNANASAGYINFFEQSSNGTNVCTFRGKSSMGNCTITLPGDTGTVVLEDNTVTLSNKTLTAPKVSALSGSSTLHNVGVATFGNTVATSGSVSGSGTLQAVGNTFLGGTLNVSGATTLAGDITATADTVTLQSANSADPLLLIKNTTNDANGARLRFVKDKGAVGADNDVAGLIEFLC